MGHCVSCIDSSGGSQTNCMPLKGRRGTKNNGIGGITYSPAKLRKKAGMFCLSSLLLFYCLFESYFCLGRDKVKRIGKDDFRILKVVGRGSYGKVFLVEKLMEVPDGDDSFIASPKSTGRFYAMKVMKKEVLYKTE